LKESRVVQHLKQQSLAHGQGPSAVYLERGGVSRDPLEKKWGGITRKVRFDDKTIPKSPWGAFTCLEKETQMES